jgi:transposase-like protein
MIATVPKVSPEIVVAGLRTVFVHPDPAEVASTWDCVARTFSPFGKITDMMTRAKGDVLAFSGLPVRGTGARSSRPTSYCGSTKNITRRADIVGISPNDEASVRLVGVVLAQQV